MGTDVRTVEGSLDARGLRFGLVVARFNSSITDVLRDGAVEQLIELGAAPGDITVVQVAGSFEIPGAVQALIDAGAVNAVVAIGCLIRGDTIHFDLISSEVARALMDIGRASGLPVALGVITTENLQQAQDRAGGKSGNKGAEAASAAVEQARVIGSLRGWA